jgi:hypothetical protein
VLGGFSGQVDLDQDVDRSPGVGGRFVDFLEQGRAVDGVNQVE